MFAFVGHQRCRFFVCAFLAVVAGKNARPQGIEDQKDFQAFKGLKPNSVAISPKDNWVAGGGFKPGTVRAIGMIKVWDFKTGKELLSYEDAKGSIECLAFSPDGNYLAAGGVGTTVKLWHLQTGKPHRTFRHSGLVRTLAFSPDGKMLATCDDDSVEQRDLIGLWNIETGAKKRLRPKEAILEHLQFSPKGNVLASASQKTISLWDTQAGKEISTFPAHEKRITCLAFSPDQKFLASASMDGTIRIWRLTKEGGQVLSLDAHNAGAWSLVFSRDGKRLISGGYDRPKDKEFGGKGTVKIWSLKEKKLLRTFDAHDLPTLSVSLAKDGRYIASGSQDGTVKVWTAPKELWHKKN